MPIILETNYSFVVSFLANDSMEMPSIVDLKKEAIAIIKLFQNVKLAKMHE